MCGIAGIITPTPTRMAEKIEVMTSSLSHRGPDGFGYAFLSSNTKSIFSYSSILRNSQAQAHFGHRRLSIIDIEGAKQPLSNEDESVWVIFNGEIYNYLEIADHLKAKGHRLRSCGDTETLVHLWEEYAEAMLDHLVGMFAFAIYDARKNIFFAARDRFGQKPFYYSQKGENLYFASELQAFKALEEFKNQELNQLAIAQYFKYGFIPSPNTVFKEIYSLPAGNYILFEKKSLSIKRYWKPNVIGEITNPDLDEIQSLLDESVRIRMRSDVPFGAFLSGGIDSGLITSSMVKQSTTKIKTFTVSSGAGYWEDESEDAKKTAKYLNTEHNEIIVKPDFLAVSDMLAKHYGQPFADHSSVMTYYVSRETRRFVKVALTGDGGDELFAGYNGYLRVPFYSIIGRLPFFFRSSFADLLKIAGLKPKHRDLSESICSAFKIPQKGENIASLFHKKHRDNAFQDDFKTLLKSSDEIEMEKFTSYYREAQSQNILDKWLETDQRLYLCDDILCKLDVASMAVSLECRSPFLDHRLAEYANKISSSAKIANNKSKAILRKLAKRSLPIEISSLPKKGFSMPLGKWIRTDLREPIREKLFENKNIWLAYLKEEAVQKIWNEHQANICDHQQRIWAIVSLISFMNKIKYF